MFIQSLEPVPWILTLWQQTQHLNVFALLLSND